MQLGNGFEEAAHLTAVRSHPYGLFDGLELLPALGLPASSYTAHLLVILSGCCLGDALLFVAGAPKQGSGMMLLSATAAECQPRLLHSPPISWLTPDASTDERSSCTGYMLDRAAIDSWLTALCRQVSSLDLKVKGV